MEEMEKTINIQKEPYVFEAAANQKHLKDSLVQDNFIDTGKYARSNQKVRYYFTTQDLLITAILGVVGGIISALVPFTLLVKTWYPFIGGTQLVSGHHILWLALAYGFTKKKAAIFLAAIFKGFSDFILGSSWSLFEIVINCYEGASLFLGFCLMEKLKEGNTNLGWGIAGGIGNVTQVPFFWILTGKIYLFHYSLLIMAMMLAFASGFLIAGILGRAIVERVQKARVL
jgi:ABC-type thiamin/hydroxymethylpyrimidine transport system permease subunit